MLKLSTKGRYGTRFMLALGALKRAKPVSLKEISGQEDISEKYLWQVVKPLRDAGLITSIAGAHGGYRIAHPLENITLKDIITALEGEIMLTSCLDEPSNCERATTCVTRELWGELSRLVADKLESLTLADLVQRHREMRSGTVHDYVI